MRGVFLSASASAPLFGRRGTVFRKADGTSQFAVGRGQVDRRIGRATRRQLMGHFEFGPDRPTAGFVDALQVGDSQEDMPPLTGTNTHLAVAVRTDQLIRTQDKYLLCLKIGASCRINRAPASVFITAQQGYSINSRYIPNHPQNAWLILLMISLSQGNAIITVKDIHNE